MKELDYDHSVFSTELIDLGHYGYKGLLTSQRERWMDVKCFQIKKALPPAWGCERTELECDQAASSKCQFTGHREGRGTGYMTPQRCNQQSLRNSIIQTNNLGCSTECKGRNIDGEEATG